MPALLTPHDEFVPAKRVHLALTSAVETRVLQWMARRAPLWVSSDQLTLLGLGGQLGAGIFYGLSRFHPGCLLLVNVCLLLNWLGDSMDGTLARVRQQQRPRYGFYVDHVVDMVGSVALMGGLGLSAQVHWPVALAMLIAFLLLAGESYLAAHTLARFQMSQGLFGPTELRLLLIAGNLALLRSSYATIFGYRFLLFDVGGAIAAVGMVTMFAGTAIRHALQLYREEPVP